MAATASCVMRIAAQKCRGLQPYCASRGGFASSKQGHDAKKNPHKKYVDILKQI